MRLSPLCGLLALTLPFEACSFTPTEDELEEDMKRLTERMARSVAGPWIGVSPVLTMDFQLQEGSGNAVSGSGTMEETAASGSVPITVTGSYSRPQLSLTFHGLIFEGHSVQATFQGSYTSFVGINGPLRLSGTGYSRDIELLLQEPEGEFARSRAFEPADPSGTGAYGEKLLPGGRRVATRSLTIPSASRSSTVRHRPSAVAPPPPTPAHPHTTHPPG